MRIIRDLYFVREDQFGNKYFSAVADNDTLYKIVTDTFAGCKIARYGTMIKMKWLDARPPDKGRPLHVEMYFHKKIWKGEALLVIDVKELPSD